MTSKQIADQIETLRSAAEKACESPETALEFLRAAGIIKPEPTPVNAAHTNPSYTAAKEVK